MTRKFSMRRRVTRLAAGLLLTVHAGMAAAQPPSGTRVLDAADHAELAAEMSADGVVRVALLDDRIARVIRTPGGFAVEHDPAAGDLYLRPAAESAEPQTTAVPQGPAAPRGPQVLFVGSEKGSTYRLTLTPVAGGPAQILIRGVDAELGDTEPAVPEDGRVAAIAGLLRAVAGGAPSPDHPVEPAVHDPVADADIVPVEVWRGSRFEAVVVARGDGAPADAPNLAAALGPDVAAVWIPEHGVDRHAAGRLAVVVREADGR